MPVFFICFIVFLLWLRVKLKQQDKNETSNKDFWQREHEADFSRNKDISMLEYISVPKEVLPFNEQTNDMELIQIQKDISDVMSKKMINLSGMTNTDINRAKQIFEYAINTLNCDISGCYIGLAKIYLENDDIDKVQKLIDKIQYSDAYLKEAITNKLNQMLQNY